MSETYRFSRRDALKYAGAGLAATTLAGTAAAHGAGVEGHPESVGDGSAHAYVEYEAPGRGRLSAIGVHLTADALSNLPAEPEGWPFPGVPEDAPYTVEYALDLPRGNTGHFSHATLDWNPGGHEPEGLYTNPHFDVHFYFPRAAAVATIPPGVPTYTIPDAQMPANTYYADDLPAGLPSAPGRGVVPAMGEHLVSIPVSLPEDVGQTDWSVFIYGAYDFDGDGSGDIIFMEPMVTTAYLEGLAEGECRTALPMPERFTDGGWYPTEYVVRRTADGYDIALESFEQFRGAA